MKKKSLSTRKSVSRLSTGAPEHSIIEQLKYAAIANKDIVDGSILRLRTS